MCEVSVTNQCSACDCVRRYLNVREEFRAFDTLSSVPTSCYFVNYGFAVSNNDFIFCGKPVGPATEWRR